MVVDRLWRIGTFLARGGGFRGLYCRSILLSAVLLKDLAGAPVRVRGIGELAGRKGRGGVACSAVRSLWQWRAALAVLWRREFRQRLLAIGECDEKRRARWVPAYVCESLKPGLRGVQL